MTSARARSPIGRQLCVMVRMALADVLFDRRITFCLALAIAALVAPILLLLGIKTGVVETLRARLLSDPSTLEVTIRGNWQLDRDWFEALAVRPELDFAIPVTRSLSAQADLVITPSRFVRRAELIPTAPGDPLLARADIAVPQACDEVVLSHSVADSLGIVAGDTVRLTVLRRVGGAFERASTEVRISATAPATVSNRDAAFVCLPLLEAVEAYVDGLPSPLFVSSDVETPPRPSYARARVYADRLEDVAPLADYIRSTGLDVTTRAREIEAVLGIDRASGIVFALIGWTATLGGAAALIGFVIINVDRRRAELAILRLIGFSSVSLAAFPAVHAATAASIGLLFALAAYYLGESVLNATLGDALASGEAVSLLPAPQAVRAVLVVLAIAVTAAVLGGFHAAKVDPAEPLRRGG